MFLLGFIFDVSCHSYICVYFEEMIFATCSICLRCILAPRINCVLHVWTREADFCPRATHKRKAASLRVQKSHSMKIFSPLVNIYKALRHNIILKSHKKYYSNGN